MQECMPLLWIAAEVVADWCDMGAAVPSTCVSAHARPARARIGGVRWHRQQARRTTRKLPYQMQIWGHGAPTHLSRFIYFRHLSALARCSDWRNVLFTSRAMVWALRAGQSNSGVATRGRRLNMDEVTDFSGSMNKIIVEHFVTLVRKGISLTRYWNQCQSPENASLRRSFSFYCHHSARLAYDARALAMLRNSSFFRCFHCHSTSTGRKVQRSNSGQRQSRKTMDVF